MLTVAQWIVAAARTATAMRRSPFPTKIHQATIDRGLISSGRTSRPATRLNTQIRMTVLRFRISTGLIDYLSLVNAILPDWGNNLLVTLPMMEPMKRAAAQWTICGLPTICQGRGGYPSKWLRSELKQ